MEFLFHELFSLKMHYGKNNFQCQIVLTLFFSHFLNVQKLKIPDIQQYCQFFVLQFDNKIILIFLSWTYNTFDYGGH